MENYKQPALFLRAKPYFGSINWENIPNTTTLLFNVLFLSLEEIILLSTYCVYSTMIDIW